MPSDNPAADIDVLVLAELTVAEFHNASAAPVILASLETDTDEATRYTVPVSVLWAVVTDAVFLTEVDVTDTVGACVSMTMALESAILAPEGSVVDVITFPAVSAIVPMVKLATVRSLVVSPACTVYVPDNAVPADAAVSVTVRSVAPVSSVTVIVLLI